MPNFRDNEDLRKLGKEYLNASLCKFVVYSLQHSETFDISHVFLPLTIAELSTLKQVWFFWPTLYRVLKLTKTLFLLGLFNVVRICKLQIIFVFQPFDIRIQASLSRRR